MTDTPAETEDDALTFAVDLDAPPEKVWRALTEPALVAAWLMPGDVRAEPGHRFSFVPAAANDDTPGPRGAVDCEVLEADPPHRLSLFWRERRDGVDSTVTFVLRAAPGGGTRLLIVHDVGAAAMPDTPMASLRMAA